MLCRPASVSPGVVGANAAGAGVGMLGVCLCVYRGRCCPQGTPLRLSIGDEGPSSIVLFPVPQTGVAANLSSVTMCGRAALGHLSLDLPQQAFLFSQRNTPLSLIAELHTLPNPAQVLCLHALGRVGACSGEELSGGAAYFFLNALILVGAMGWGLCGKPNP